MRQILGGVAEFEKTTLVAKLKAARERKKAVTGKCGGRKSFAERDAVVVALAKKLAWAGETGRILNGRRHRQGGDRPEAGNAHQPARRFILLRELCDGALKPLNRFVEVPQLHH